MSAPTIPAGSFDDFDSFLRFAAITRDFDRDDLPEPDLDGHHKGHRRARADDKRAAIDASLRGREV